MTPRDAFFLAALAMFYGPFAICAYVILWRNRGFDEALARGDFDRTHSMLAKGDRWLRIIKWAWGLSLVLSLIGLAL